MWKATHYMWKETHLIWKVNRKRDTDSISCLKSDMDNTKTDLYIKLYMINQCRPLFEKWHVQCSKSPISYPIEYGELHTRASHFCKSAYFFSFQKAHIYISKRTRTLLQKSLTFLQKSVRFLPKGPTLLKKSLTFVQKSPMCAHKSFTFLQTLTSAKARHISAKVPHIFAKRARRFCTRARRFCKSASRFCKRARRFCKIPSDFCKRAPCVRIRA